MDEITAAQSDAEQYNNCSLSPAFKGCNNVKGGATRLRMQKLCHSVCRRDGEKQTREETVARVPGRARRDARGTARFLGHAHTRSPRIFEPNDRA